MSRIAARGDAGPVPEPEPVSVSAPFGGHASSEVIGES